MTKRLSLIVYVAVLVACDDAAPPCDVDDDCATGTYCRAGTGCTSECAGDDACTGGETCDLSRGRCSGGGPDGGVCRAEDCDDGSYCNGPEGCAAGACATGTAPCLTGQTCDEDADTCVTDCTVTGDADGDGHDSMDCGGDDCDDADADRFPGNAEVCDVSHDEDCDEATLGTLDSDGDGVISAMCCNGSACEADCNDGNANVRPSQAEVCNGFDDNCDGATDEGLTVPLYPDADGDMFGDRAATAEDRCAGAAGFSNVATDCDDRDNAVFPGATEVCDVRDQDCDGTLDEGAGLVFYRDFDRDGYGTSETMVACTRPDGWASETSDCNDMSAGARPGGVEICDLLDNDCNGTVDDALGSECSLGLGACQTFGRRYCNGTCSVMGGTPVTMSRTSPATNGSWDWDCDGTVTTEVRTFEQRDSVSGAPRGAATFPTPPTITYLPYQSSDPAACTAAGSFSSTMVCWPASTSTTPTTCGAELRCMLRATSAGFGNACVSPAPSGSWLFASCGPHSDCLGAGSSGTSSPTSIIIARVSCR